MYQTVDSARSAPPARLSSTCVMVLGRALVVDGSLYEG